MAKVIEYYATDSMLSAFVRTTEDPDSLACVQTPLDYTALQRHVRRLREGLSAPTGSSEERGQLHELLIVPLYKRGVLTPGEPVLIGPHRCLHSVPFQALGNGSTDMLAAHSITYVPTARMARLLAGSVDLSAGSLVVVHSRCSDSVLLRESFEREAECVARVTGGSLLAGEEASPKALTEMLGGRRLVHFTCHGMFDGDDVRHSGLLLAGDHGSDALCDVEALSRMRLDVDLVVLAGCETGLSDRHPGDELVGLVRAFTLAGAGSVLASLWPVHTLSTEILMRRFYSELVSGIRQSDALRAAQMHVRSCTRSEVVAELRRELESRGEGACGAGRDLLTQRIRLLEAGEDDGGAVGTCPAARPPRGGPAEHEALPYAHPYFWAPFVLVGGMR